MFSFFSFFSFVLVSLFFGLLCRAGFPIVRHTLLSSTSQSNMAVHMLRPEDIPIKQKQEKHSYPSRVKVDV